MGRGGGGGGAGANKGGPTFFMHGLKGGPLKIMQAFCQQLLAEVWMVSTQGFS